jgi:ribosomal protein S18 acetylase RimI-like enzyme
MFQIRPCREEDFEHIFELLRQLWPDRPLAADSLRVVYERALASDWQAYVCATAGEMVVGFASLSVKNNLWQEGFLGHVDELVVDEEYRGRGVGTQLLGHLIALAKQRGCRRIELDSALNRQAAHRFYQRQGFDKRGYVFSKKL